MFWLTWRQSRAAAVMMFFAPVVLAAILGLTGPDFNEQFKKEDHQVGYYGTTAIVLVLPALVGFWGASLISRELEAGTHRLVWNQSISRTRWLAVKLGLTGLAAMTALGLLSLAVTWWSAPIDETTAISPWLFTARGIVPIGYAAFAFVLGATIGMLVRRPQLAMALTFAVFLCVQIAMPGLRAHLFRPTRSTVKVTASNLETLFSYEDRIIVDMKVPEQGALFPSSRTVDKSGDAVGTIPLSPSSGPCASSQTNIGRFEPFDRSACVAEIKRLGYQEEIIYYHSSRFWPFQWYETGIYTALTLGLAGFCFWRIQGLS